MPREKSVEGMDMDEFFDAVARAQVVRTMLCGLIAEGVAGAFGGKKE